MADDELHRTAARRTAPRRGPARWGRPLGVVGLVAGFLLLAGALSKLTAGGEHTAAAWTALIVLAVASVALITAGAGGLHPGRNHRTPQH